MKNSWLGKGMGFIVFILKCMLFVSLGLSFFLLMAIDNPQIIHLSRTSGVTLVTFVVLLAALMTAFGGFSVGRQKSKTIVYSMTIATVMTDVVTFLQLMIMNVHPSNRSHLEVLGTELALLAACIIIQFALIVMYTYFGNHVYFKGISPARCCVVTQPDSVDLDALLKRIGQYKLQYRVEKVIDYRALNIKSVILEHDAVFFCDVPPVEKTELIEYSYTHGKSTYYVTEVIDVINRSASKVMLDDLPVMAAENYGLSLEQRFIKRAMDIIASFIAIVLLSPLMLICAAAIFINDGGPVFFRQDRYTRGGRIFSIIKFRTMRQSGGGVEHSATQDDDRITRVGRLLRKYRLDEIPQFFNILKGDMSLVGPRPEMVENHLKYKEALPEFSYRLRVKAGLTGYAQIAGKYNTSPKDKMILDLMYISSYSIWSDVSILLQTPLVLFKKDSTEGFVQDEEPVKVEEDVEIEYTADARENV